MKHTISEIFKLYKGKVNSLLKQVFWSTFCSPDAKSAEKSRSFNERHVSLTRTPLKQVIEYMHISDTESITFHR